MSWIAAITSGAAGVWASVQALVKAGVSSGAIQLIAGALTAIGSSAKESSLKKNCALAVADVVEYEPNGDNIENLTNAIARLSYVLEQELKAKKERENEKTNG